VWVSCGGNYGLSIIAYLGERHYYCDLIGIVVAVTVELAAAYHVLGTDKIGQDVLYNSLKSIRTGLLIGTLTTLIMLPFAVLLGISAGYFGGWIDDLIQYVYTTLNAIPGVLLIAAAVLIMQVYIEMHPAMFDSAAARTDFRLLFLCIILGITSWTGLCRLLRGETLKLRELDYVQAARAFGVSDWRLMVRHILPNLYHLILISVVMDFSGLVLAEAVLSYLGVGGSGDAELGQYDQCRTSGNGTRPGGMVALSVSVWADVYAGAGGKPVCR
jgi:ABC-type dipeptide/oligopeptide/nickel transport systems, permease components